MEWQQNRLANNMVPIQESPSLLRTLRHNRSTECCGACSGASICSMPLSALRHKVRDEPPISSGYSRYQLPNELQCVLASTRLEGPKQASSRCDCFNKLSFWFLAGASVLLRFPPSCIRVIILSAAAKQYNAFPTSISCYPMSGGHLLLALALE